MSHYFAPLSSCNTSHVSEPLASLPALSDHEDAARVVVVKDDVGLPAFRMRLPNFVSLLPDEHAALLRWFSATSAYIMRPSAALTEQVSRQRLAMQQLPARYVGMHVRRGHKWVETAAQPLEDYVAEAQKLSLLLLLLLLLLPVHQCHGAAAALSLDGGEEERIAYLYSPGNPPRDIVL